MPDDPQQFTRFVCQGCQKRFKIPVGKHVPRLCQACAKVEAQASAAPEPAFEDLAAAIRDEQLSAMEKNRDDEQPELPEPHRPPLPVVFRPVEDHADRHQSRVAAVVVDEVAPPRDSFFGDFVISGMLVFCALFVITAASVRERDNFSWGAALFIASLAFSSVFFAILVGIHRRLGFIVDELRKRNRD